MNTQTRATREYDGKKFGRFEQVPRHGASHDRKKRNKDTHFDRLSAQRGAPVVGTGKKKGDET